MSTLDPERERQRLAGLYAGMTDGELQKIAGDADSLSDVARLTLASEMHRRNLNILADRIPPVAQDDVEQQALVTIRQFRDLPEALLAKGMLDSAGIECFLGDDNMVRMDWFISNLLGGIKLRVKPDDAEAANEILNQPVPEGFEVEGVGDYEQPRCPKCQSVDVTFEGLNKPVAYGTAFVGLPIPVVSNAWKCEACGARWEETEDSKP